MVRRDQDAPGSQRPSYYVTPSSPLAGVACRLGGVTAMEATDWIAGYAAVVSTVALGWQILKERRARRPQRLKGLEGRFQVDGHPSYR